jgi:hypothetical protein
MWAGAPARFVRKLSGDEKDELQKIAEEVKGVGMVMEGDVEGRRLHVTNWPLKGGARKGAKAIGRLLA